MCRSHKMLLILICLAIVFPGKVYSQATLVDTSFYCPTLGSNRNLEVYLPHEYNCQDTAGYAAAYFLHGVNCNHRSYDILFDIYNTLCDNSIIEPIIIVKPDGYTGPYQGSCFSNSELYGLFEDYVIIDLINFIDSTFRTVPDREHRYIMGHSMGGFAAMKLAFKHPGLFKAVISNSAPFDLRMGMQLWRPHILRHNGSYPYTYTYGADFFTDFMITMAGAFSANLNDTIYYADLPLDVYGDIVDSVMASWAENDPDIMAPQLPSSIGLNIYFDCGRWDNCEFFPLNQSFENTLDLYKIPHVAKFYPGDHISELCGRLMIDLGYINTLMKPGPLAVSLMPEEVPASVTAGGSFEFTGIIVNNTDEAAVFDTWVMVDSPGGRRYGPNNSLFKDRRLEPREVYIESDIRQEFPEWAGPGVHKYIVFCGEYPDVVIDSFAMDLMVSEKGNSLPRGQPHRPSDIELVNNYPNPFNNSTNISFNLNNPGGVSLDVYNLCGRKIVTLLDGYLDSGHYDIPLNAAGLSSGVYFYRLTAGDGAIKRSMTLIK